MVFNKVALFTSRNTTTKQEPVSVIICARNERENLEKYLPSVIDQDYPVFEVVVIDDGSWDGTEEFLEELSKHVKNLKVVTLKIEDRFHRGKKFAVTMGIKAAQYNRLLLTDADCRPVSDQWIKSMVAAAGDDKEIVIGYSPYKAGWSPLKMFIHYETLHTALQYLGYALNGMPYMAVGRNLSYTRDLFFSVKGFAKHQHLLSGDDDLFVNQTANKINTSVQMVPESFVETYPKKSFSRWSRQKSRHLSTGRFYKAKHRFWLGTYSFFHFVFYFSLLLLLGLRFDWIWLASVVVLKFAVQYAVFYPAAMKLRSTRSVALLPLFDFLFLFYNLTLGLKGLFMKPEKWN
jgi:glycosyltransferase involved in cell wall biosynthesis